MDRARGAPLPALPRRGLDFLEQRRARARDFVAPFGIALDDPGADAWFDAYLLRYEESWSLHPDAERCLTALTAAPSPARIGVITNGERGFQQAKIDAIGLAPWFEHTVTSAEFGIAKPDAAIFHHAASLFGVAPAAACYVGDRLHTDAIGAARAGLTGIWIDRPGTATPGELVEARDAGVAVIRTLDEVPGILAARG